MSKLIVHCKDHEYTVEEVAGTVYLHKRAVAKSLVIQPNELLFAVSPEEASYIAGAISSVLGKGVSSMEPKERIIMSKVAEPKFRTELTEEENPKASRKKTK